MMVPVILSTAQWGDHRAVLSDVIEWETAARPY